VTPGASPEMRAPATVPARSSRGAQVLALLPWAPLVGAAAYALVLAVRIKGLVHDTATSDSVGPMAIAQALPGAHRGSTVVMGNAAHYTTLWFDMLTRHLPAYRLVWQAAPYLLSLLGVVLLARTVRRLAGPRPAVVALAIALCAPPLVLAPLLVQAFHETTVVNGVVLAWLLATLASARYVVTPRLLLLTAAVAVVTGLDLASDPLLLVAGVIPFAVAASLPVLRRRDEHRAVELAAMAGGATVVAVAVGAATELLMRHAGFHVQGLPLGIAGLGRMRDNATLLGHLVLDMGNGRLSLHGLGILGPVSVVCGVLAVLGALAPPAMLLRAVLRAASPRDDATTLWLAFWGATAVCIAVAFVVTTVAADRNSMRYLVPTFFAVAATVPFVAVPRLPRLQAGVAAAVAVTSLSGAVVLAHADVAADFDVQPQHADGLVAALEAHGLHHGYAGYWQANLLTWDSDGAVVSRAVQQGAACHAAQRGWFCPYPIFTVSDWFTPQAGPSFLIREIGGAFVPDPPPPRPRPVSVFNYDRFEVYVYDHDIALDAARNASGWSNPQAATP